MDAAPNRRAGRPCAGGTRGPSRTRTRTPGPLGGSGAVRRRVRPALQGLPRCLSIGSDYGVRPCERCLVRSTSSSCSLTSLDADAYSQTGVAAHLLRTNVGPTPAAFSGRPRSWRASRGRLTWPMKPSSAQEMARVEDTLVIRWTGPVADLTPDTVVGDGWCGSRRGGPARSGSLRRRRLPLGDRQGQSRAGEPTPLRTPSPGCHRVPPTPCPRRVRRPMATTQNGWYDDPNAPRGCVTGTGACSTSPPHGCEWPCRARPRGGPATCRCGSPTDARDEGPRKCSGRRRGGQRRLVGAEHDDDLGRRLRAGHGGRASQRLDPLRPELGGHSPGSLSAVVAVVHDRA